MLTAAWSTNYPREATNSKSRCRKFAKARTRLASPRGAQIISIPNDDGRHNQNEQTEADQPLGAKAGTVPFLQPNAPEGAEDHDAGHVQSPAGEFVSPHLRFAHGVEKELEVPGSSRQGGEEIVGEQRRF